MKRTRPRHLGRIHEKELTHALDKAHDALSNVCESRDIGTACRPFCMAGGIGTIGNIYRIGQRDVVDRIGLDRAVDTAARMAKKSVCDEVPREGGCRAQCNIGISTAAQTFSGVMRAKEEKEMGRLKRIGGRLGIIVAPGDPCKKGFTRKIVKSKLNKKVHVCFLDKGYRKYDPETHKAPYRRLRKFGPGIEHEKILESEAHRYRKSGRVLTED